MKYIFLESLPSTQEYLITQIKCGAVDSNLCIIAKTQSAGIGSRGNKWEGVEKGVYFSFAFLQNLLPKDLQTQSMAIFFAFHFMQSLQKLGSQIWLKYPNDLFFGEKKVGGVMCGIVGDFAVCGIGLNLHSQKFTHLESHISKSLIADDKSLETFLQGYFDSIAKSSWEAVFHAYSVDFHKNYNFSFHHNNAILSLKNATLQKDGSIKIDDKIIYCVR